MFGYEDATYTLAVEQFMQRYYRTVMDVSLLNEMLLQLFREAILTDDEHAADAAESALPDPQRLISRSRSDDVFDRISVRDARAVRRASSRTRRSAACALDDARSSTRHLWLIDEEFRQHPRNHRLFLEILRAPVGVTHELRRMNLYGVLGRYIPAFGRIVGRMQYDLFHAYTVDAHTLFVVSNLRRLAMPQFDHELPSCRGIMQSLPKPELALSRGALPRHRQGPRRRSLGARRRRRRRRSASSRACRATTRAWSPGWCAIT